MMASQYTTEVDWLCCRARKSLHRGLPPGFHRHDSATKVLQEVLQEFEPTMTCTAAGEADLGVSSCHVSVPDLSLILP